MTMKKDRQPGKWWDRNYEVLNGCSEVSPACDNCFARSYINRFGNMESKDTRWQELLSPGGKRWNGKVKLCLDHLDIPARTQRPTEWFVTERGDLFHPAVPDGFIAAVYARMKALPRHTFLVLTKRAQRMAEYMDNYEYFNYGPLPSHIWSGVTVENQNCADERIPHLLKVHGKRFISAEPLLSDIDLSRGKGKISCCIVGCESGPHRRPTDIKWVAGLRDQCERAGILFFLKQLDIMGKIQKLPALDGYVHVGLPWRSQS